MRMTFSFTIDVANDSEAAAMQDHIARTIPGAEVHDAEPADDTPHTTD